MSADSRNLWLDLIRGISALLVCLGHLRNAILVDLSQLKHPNMLVKMFYALTGLGHQAVMVFFVLSGYFVGGAILRSGINFSWRNYLTSRLTRLWVVLLPSLAITWVVGQILGYFSPEVLAGAYAENWHSGPKADEYSASLTTFLANILFLQTIVTPVFGINGPLWSLANEFWYYLLFPLLMIVTGLVGSASFASRVVTFLAALAIACYLPNTMLYGFLVWLMGAVVYRLQSIVKSLNTAKVYMFLLMALAMFGIALGFAKSSTFAIASDIAVGLTFAMVCLMLTRVSFPALRWPWLAKFALYGSDISYSLYLLHFPLVVLAASLVYQSQKSVPTALFLAQFLGWVVLLIGCGFFMWWLFESRTPIVRKQVNAWLDSTW
jgi:peptidoglycan/LPS O-acetylase OafA/YrhL